MWGGRGGGGERVWWGYGGSSGVGWVILRGVDRLLNVRRRLGLGLDECTVVWGGNRMGAVVRCVQFWGVFCSFARYIVVTLMPVMAATCLYECVCSNSSA